jgi:hypothetical protein
MRKVRHLFMHVRHLYMVLIYFPKNTTPPPQILQKLPLKITKKTPKNASGEVLSSLSILLYFWEYFCINWGDF